MGGVAQPLPFLQRLRAVEGVSFVVTGAPRTGREGNLLLFGAEERLYMPDLIQAADAVVAKAGYSTIAEVWNAGRAMAWVTREGFRETQPLRAWLEAHVPGFEIPGATFPEGTWVDRLAELLALERPDPSGRNGAGEVADYLVERLGL